MKLTLDNGTVADIKIIPGNSIVIATVDTVDMSEVERLARSLTYMGIFKRHNITPIASPKNITWTVIPDGQGRPKKLRGRPKNQV